MQRAAAGGVNPTAATMTLKEYGNLNMPLALRQLEPKTTDLYLAGWRKRVVPTLGHVPVRMISFGAVDRSVLGWIADGCSKSTIKNSLAMLVRVMEQAYRDGIIDRNPARIKGWQSEFQQAEDELDDPRTFALPNWEALEKLGSALVERSADKFAGWGLIVKFMACTAARIGEVSGVRVCDIDQKDWMWTVRRQTTPGPGGAIVKTCGSRSFMLRQAERSRRVVRPVRR
jgi:integrase